MSTEETTKSKPKKKTKTKILKWTAALAIALIMLAVLAVPWYVSSRGGREMILSKINGSIDGKVDFASLTMGWLKGIKVINISFDDNAGQTSVRVKQITTKPRYLSILTGSLSLGQTEILEPRAEINLVPSPVQPRQQAASSGKKTAVKKSRPIALPVKKLDLTIKDGNLKVTDAKAGTIELSRINSRLDLRPAGERTNFDIALAVVDGGRESKISANGRVVPGRGWRWKGTSGEVTVEVNDLELESLAPIFALGGIEVGASGKLSGNIKGEISNGQLENLTAKVDGSNLNVDTVKLTGGRFKTSRLGVNVKLARAKQMINIESFDIESDWFKADGQGTIPATFGSLDDFLRTDSSLSGSFQLDAAQLAGQMPGVLGLKAGTRVTSGTLKGNVESMMEAGARKIKGQTTLERLEGTVGGRMAALSAPVLAEVEITSDKSGTKLNKLDLSSGFAVIKCSGTDEQLDYHGDVNLAKFQTELGQFVDTKGYGIAGEFTSQGKASISRDKFTTAGSAAVRNLRLRSAEGVSIFAPTVDMIFSAATGQGWSAPGVKDFDVKAKVSLASTNYFGFYFGPTDVDIQIENGLLKIAPFSSVVNNGRLNFAGEADLTRKPTLLKTPGPIQIVKDVQINEEVTRRLLVYLNPIFANAVRVSGTANFECERLTIPLAENAKNDIEVIGTVSITQLRMEAGDLLGQILSVGGASERGVDITIHPTKFILQNGYLKYDDMQMDVGDNPVNFAGVIGLDKSLNMTVTLPYTTAGRTARIGKEVEGARIALPLRGTVDKPKLDLGRLLQDQLKQQLMKELEKVLSK
ncbi:MAG: hypothetical protein PHY02_02845 [Phycisphaerae bacterium]|nr:hypothetical protein [Phycisphaerae bacterium]